MRTEVGVALRTCDRLAGGGGADGACERLDYRNTNRLWLGGRAALGDRVAARFRTEVRNRTAPTATEVDDLGDAQAVSPVDLRVREAWVEAYDVGARGLDLRVGAQRIPWGVGDGWSPTDRLNPYDLEDPTQFDARLPVPAALATWHLGPSWILSAAYIPFFVPALLPADHFDLADSAQAGDLVDLEPHIGGEAPEVGDVRVRIDPPPVGLLGQAATALRVAWTAPEPLGDVAVGWYRGRDSVPQASGEVIPVSLDGDTADLTVNARHPRLDMLAVEYRGPFPVPVADLDEHVSVWGEVAAVFPSRTVAYVTASRLRDLARLGAIESAPDADVTGVVQDGEPYAQAVAGLDFDIPAVDLYANLQWVHGFLIERPPDDLHDYAVAALRYPAGPSPLTLQARGAFEVGDPDAGELGWLASARLTYRLGDHLRIGLLALVQDGRPGTTFRRFRDLSEARVEVGARF